jgi:DNA-binding CsgD family transcriptional regulator
MAAFGLSPKETEISLLAIEGLTDEAIGKQTGMAAKSVVNHVKPAFSKTGSSDRIELLHRLYGTT